MYIPQPEVDSSSEQHSAASSGEPLRVGRRCPSTGRLRFLIGRDDLYVRSCGERS